MATATMQHLADISSKFELKTVSDKLFSSSCKIIKIGKSNGLKKDGTKASANSADLVITIDFGSGYKSFGAYSSSIFPNGIPKMPLGGIEGIATFKEREGYEPSLTGFQFDEEEAEGRIRAYASKKLALVASIEE